MALTSVCYFIARAGKSAFTSVFTETCGADPEGEAKVLVALACRGARLQRNGMVPPWRWSGGPRAAGETGSPEALLQPPPWRFAQEVVALGLHWLLPHSLSTTTRSCCALRFR